MDHRDDKSAETAQRRAASPHEEELVASMMAGEISPEEFAARHGHTILCFSLDERRLKDPIADAWIRRLGDIFFHRDGAPALKELQERYLTPEKRREVEEYEF